MINRLIRYICLVFPFLNDRLIMFLIVGGFSTLINYGIFYVLFEFLTIHYLVSSVSGYVSGLLFGFVANKKWTYRDHVKKNKEKMYIHRYVMIYLLSLAVSSACLKGLVDFCSIDARIGNICAIIISTCLNYIGLNIFVFNDSGRSKNK
jgi:putative flippase GtrA